MINFFWYKPCPKCNFQGRLVVYKYTNDNSLFLCCDECMACWNNPNDVDVNPNDFSEFNIKQPYQKAINIDISIMNWQIYNLKNYKI